MDNGAPFRRDPKSGAIIYNNLKERKDQKVDRIFKNHLHKEVQFLADCTNWTVDDFTKKIGEMNTIITDLQTTVTDLQARLEASLKIIDEMQLSSMSTGTSSTVVDSTEAVTTTTKAKKKTND